MGHLIWIAKVGSPVTLAELPTMTFHNAPRSPARIEIGDRLITVRGQGKRRVRLDVHHVGHTGPPIGQEAFTGVRSPRQTSSDAIAAD